MNMQRIRFFSAYLNFIQYSHRSILKKVRDRLKAQQELLVFDLLPCKNVMGYAYECSK